MKQHPAPHPVNDDVLDEGLPPMAEDEEAGGEDGELEDIVDDQRDDGMSWLDDRVGIEDYDDATIANEIGATEGAVEPTWTDGSEADEALEGTESDVGGGEEYGWTQENEEAGTNGWDDGLDLVDEAVPSILDDGGEEGVDDEHMDIDTTSWRALDDASDGEGTEEEEEVVDLELGLSFEQEMRSGGELLPPLLEAGQVRAAWLGPAEAQVAAAAFGAGGSLWAAGAGLFATARSELAATASSRAIEEAQATSIAVGPGDAPAIYVGTLLGGALVTRDAGATLEPRNAWAGAARGCGRPEAPGAPVRVAMSQAPHSPTLWVHTARGHVLRSRDGGESFGAALPEARVLAFACDAEGPAVAALAVDGQGLAVHWSAEGDAFERRVLPPAAGRLARAPEPRIAVRGGALLLGDEDLEVGLLFSASAAAGWTILEDCPRATALAMTGDPASPVLLAGLFFAGLDLGTLARKVGEGPWVRVCDVGKLERLFAVERAGVDEISTRIHDIAVNPLDRRHVALSTGLGVFVLEMKDV